ncbi:hypothetical protein KCU78_g2617, partial [Aureobasidium melanogenum]
MIPTFAANIISLKASLVRMCFGSPFLMLYPCIDTSAVQTILPRMENIEVLDLAVSSDYSTASIFSHLRTRPALESRLAIPQVPQQNPQRRRPDPSYSSEATRIPRTETKFFNTSIICLDLFAAILDSLPVLQSFTLYASHAFGDQFLLALGRGYHALRYLTLDGLFTLEPLDAQVGVLLKTPSGLPNMCGGSHTLSPLSIKFECTENKNVAIRGADFVALARIMWHLYSTIISVRWFIIEEELEPDPKQSSLGQNYWSAVSSRHAIILESFDDYLCRGAQEGKIAIDNGN